MDFGLFNAFAILLFTPERALERINGVDLCACRV